MKILLASDVYPPFISGVAVYTRDIKNALIKRGHEVKAIIPKYGSQTSPDTVTVPTIKVPLYPSLKAGIPYSRDLLKKVKVFDPDVIHVQTQGTVGLRASAIAKKLHIPSIGTFHTYFLYENIFNELSAGFLFPIFNELMWNYNKWFYDRFDGLISPSKNLIKYLKSAGIKPPINHIPNPIDLETIKTGGIDETLVKKKYQLGEKNALYVGRISGEKNLENLIKSFAVVKKPISKVKLILVGDGPSVSTLKKLIQELSLSRDTIFTGAIPRQELLSSGLFQTADVFATTSESENQPLTVLEAMAFGLPIVGVAAMGMPELITDNGLLSPPGDVQKFAENLNKVLGNEKLRKKLGENSRKNAKRYDINTVIDQLVNYYKRFVD